MEDSKIVITSIDYGIVVIISINNLVMPFVPRPKCSKCSNRDRRSQPVMFLITYRNGICELPISLEIFVSPRKRHIIDIVCFVFDMRAFLIGPVPVVQIDHDFFPFSSKPVSIEILHQFWLLVVAPTESPGCIHCI